MLLVEILAGAAEGAVGSAVVLALLVLLVAREFVLAYAAEERPFGTRGAATADRYVERMNALIAPLMGLFALIVVARIATVVG